MRWRRTAPARAAAAAAGGAGPAVRARGAPTGAACAPRSARPRSGARSVGRGCARNENVRCVRDLLGLRCSRQLDSEM